MHAGLALKAKCWPLARVVFLLALRSYPTPYDHEGVVEIRARPRPRRAQFGYVNAQSRHEEKHPAGTWTSAPSPLCKWLLRSHLNAFSLPPATLRWCSACCQTESTGLFWPNMICRASSRVAGTQHGYRQRMPQGARRGQNAREELILKRNFL